MRIQATEIGYKLATIGRQNNHSIKACNITEKITNLHTHTHTYIYIYIDKCQEIYAQPPVLCHYHPYD